MNPKDYWTIDLFEITKYFISENGIAVLKPETFVQRWLLLKSGVLQNKNEKRITI